MRSRAFKAVLGLSMAMVILSLSFLAVTLVPYFTHTALRLADSSQLLGVSQSQAARWSDQTISRLLFGGSFRAIVGPGNVPLYGPAEAAHLSDVRTHLWFVLALGLIGALTIAVTAIRLRNWQVPYRYAMRGAWTLAGLIVALGLAGLVNFNAGFIWFHKILFPEGNYMFSDSSRMIELYPDAFWQFIGGLLGLIVLLLVLVAWQIKLAPKRTSNQPA